MRSTVPCHTASVTASDSFIREVMMSLSAATASGERLLLPTEGTAERLGDVVMPTETGAEGVVAALRLALMSKPGRAERRASGATHRGCQFARDTKGSFAGASPTGFGTARRGGMEFSRTFLLSATAERVVAGAS
jgi:hypothetical protein